MNYAVAFDIANVGYRQWWFPAVGLIFVAVGLVMVRFRSALPFRGPALLRRAFTWVFLGFSVIWTALALAGTYWDYSRLSNALRAGDVKIVEGEVVGFVPMPYEGHSNERFCVEGTCFEYSDYEVTGGFNNTASHGGPIRPGLRVRVTHVGGVIVRLEIGQP